MYIVEYCETTTLNSASLQTTQSGGVSLETAAKMRAPDEPFQGGTGELWQDRHRIWQRWYLSGHVLRPIQQPLDVWKSWSPWSCSSRTKESFPQEDWRVFQIAVYVVPWGQRPAKNCLIVSEPWPPSSGGDVGGGIHPPVPANYKESTNVPTSASVSGGIPIRLVPLGRML